MTRKTPRTVRRRHLHAAFVVTVSTLTVSAACNSKTGGPINSGGGSSQLPPQPVPTTTGYVPIHENPPAQLPVQQSQDPAAFGVQTPQGRVNWDDYPKEINPRTAKHKTIYRAADYCYYNGELEERPRSWVPLPQKRVPCPPVMTAPHWSHCRRGSLHANTAGDTCLCAMDGNPPPPAHLQDCPSG
jgi:hypothetical protein